jgi:hypothetical protein
MAISIIPSVLQTAIPQASVLYSTTTFEDEEFALSARQARSISRLTA